MESEDVHVAGPVQDVGSNIDNTSLSTVDDTVKDTPTSEGDSTDQPPVTVAETLPKDDEDDAPIPASSEIKTDLDSLAEEETEEPSTSAAGVISASANVVVERVGAGLLNWNLTATDGEGKDVVSVFPSTILTQDQILQIDAALKSECLKDSATAPLIEAPEQEENLASIDPASPTPLEDPPEPEEKMNLNTSNDPLNLEAVLDIGPASLNTKDLMNQVMRSDLLMEAIGGEDLVASALDVSTTSDGDSESGLSSESSPSKKQEEKRREEKRRSARIAHITANDLTIRQALRDREQKKKEKEERKRQKEEERRAKEVKDSPGSGSGTSVASPETKEVITGTDLNSEIAKYLQVIDQEINKGADGDSPSEDDAAVKEEQEKKEEPKEKEAEKGKARLSLFENLTKKESKDVKSVEDTKKENAEDAKKEDAENVKKENPEGFGEPSQEKNEQSSKCEKNEPEAGETEKGGDKFKKEEEANETKSEKEPGEVEEEEKEVGELSDHEDVQQGSSVYWMDHSYAASSSKSNLPATATDEAASDASSRRHTRRSKKAKEEEEQKEERPRRSSRRESKAAKESSSGEVKAEEKVREDKHHKKKKKKDEKEKHRSRSKSSERESSHSRDSRSKSIEGRETDAQKKKKPKEEKEESKRRSSRHSKDDKEEKSKEKRLSRHSKDEKEEKSKEKRSSRHSKDEKGKEKQQGEETKKSIKRSRDAKKSKHVDEAELSDIPFSSEEDEPDAGEHDSGSEWTSDDDPEKLWCICRKPHDGKFMICCDKCEDWFHGKCVSITKKEGKRMEQEDVSWVCPKCTEAEKKGVEEATAEVKDEGKKKKQEPVELEDTPVKDKSKGKDTKKKKDKEKVEKEGEKEKEEKVKKKEGKEVDEKKRKRKSSVGHKKETEEPTKDEPEESVPSKKKRLKFFRPPPPKQHCIGTRCDNWARSGSVYCSPDCIVKHAKESMRQLSAEKDRATGVKGRRDSAGGSSSVKLREDERISVIERHTGRLRTGLTAPTYEELPYWLGRHPTYEVLRPNIKHGYTASSSSSGKPSSKHKSESRRVSHEGGDSTRSVSSSDTERKISTKHITSPTKETGSGAIAEALERRQRERREKVRQLLEMKRREEEALERDLERRRMEETRRRREEEKREEEERRKKEEEKRKREEKERRERERKEKEERMRMQAENSKLAEQTSESVRVNVKRTLLDVLLTRVKKAGDMKRVAADDVKKIAKQVEFELYKLFNDTGAKYKAKYRTLIFNIKDMKNKGLFRHILKGEISPWNLVRMSSDQLASQELTKWREQEAKHELDMIVQTEEEKKSMPNTYVKKTHKGEVELGDVMGEEGTNTEEDPVPTKRNKSSSQRSEPKTSKTTPTTPTTPTNYYAGSASPTTPTSPPTPTAMLIDTTDQHKAHLFDLNCKICTGKVLAVQEEKVPKKTAVVRRTPKVTKKVKVQRPPAPKEPKEPKGEKPVKFFGEEVEEEKEKKKYRPPPEVIDELYDDLFGAVGSGGEDDDDDDDYNDKNVVIREPEPASTTPPGSPKPTVRFSVPKAEKKKPARPPAQVKKSSSLSAATVPSSTPPPWRGFIFMHEVSKFVAVAHHVSGPASSIPMDLQDTLEVCGRIPYRVVWDYFGKLKQSQSTEMTVMRFHVWQPDEEAAYFSLFDYFYTRQRIGVIGKNRPHVKDFYLIALPSTDRVPSQILPFNGPGLPTKRPHMLLGIVVRHKEKPRSMSLDSDPVNKPVSQQREPPPQQPVAKKKQTQDEILPPTNPMVSFQSALPNIRTMSEIIDSKDANISNVPFKSKEVYVTESQLVDPIVAQYANAAPEELEVELEEPYSPTTEEREAPYDPSDPTDDWISGRRMPTAAVIPEPAIPLATKQFEVPEDKEDVGGVFDTRSQPAESKVQPSDITDESDASQDLLSAFSDQSGLSEQQQLLIQLTKQVEEAKKALLDRQIESLQTEINKATNKLGKGDESQSDDAGTSPDVRLAPADSSTMTPKDDVTSTPGGVQSEATAQRTEAQESVEPVPELAPPPELPPFAVGAVLWNAARQEEKKSSAAPQKQHPNLQQVQTPVEGVGGPPGRMDPAHPERWAEESWRQLPQHDPKNQWSQENQPPIVPPKIPDAFIPDPRHNAPPPGHRGDLPPRVPHPHLPPLPHSAPHQHPTPPHLHHQAPMQHPDPRSQLPVPHHPPPHHAPPHHPPPNHPPPQHPPPQHPPPQHPPPQHPPPQHPPPQHPPPQHPPPQQPAPEPQPPPVSKKRKLEPPPPGVEGWKYGDDDEGRGGDDDPPRDTPHSPEPLIERRRSSGRADWDKGPGKDVDLRRGFEGHSDTDERERRGSRREGDHRDNSWTGGSESWSQERWDRDRRPDREQRGWEDPRRRRDPRRSGDDFHRRDFDKRGQTVDYQHRKPMHGGNDPRMRHEKSGNYQRDFDYRNSQR